MNHACKSSLENLKEAQQIWNRERNLSPEEQVESKLVHLQMFIVQLEKTPGGKVELNIRLKHFGKCKRMAGEGTSQFYGRLRHWLDRDTTTKQPSGSLPIKSYS